MTKKIILISISLVLVVLASIVIYQFLMSLLVELANENNSGSQSVVINSNDFNFLLYIQCLSFLFSLISLPIILWALADLVSKKNWLKIVLGLELVGLLLAFITAPPDMSSRLLVFVFWQLPVLVNLIILRLRI